MVLGEKESQTKNDNDMTDQEKVDLWFSFCFWFSDVKFRYLDLESSSQNRKKVVVEQAGDIRDEFVRQFETCGALWATKYSMITKLVEPLCV